MCGLVVAALIIANCTPAMTSGLRADLRCEASVSIQLVRDDHAPKRTSSSSSATLAAEIRAFVSNRYLKAGPDATALTSLFTERVDAFGKRQVPRAEIVREKLKYYSLWPDRSYVMQPDTLVIVPTSGMPTACRVSFQYMFRVSGARGRRAGRGPARLVLVRDRHGRLLIASEQGDVIERY